MSRVMRRRGQELPEEECGEILRSCSTGVLGLMGADDYPYAVPLNYVYGDGRIYFHCAQEGHKMDCIRNDCRVSFCVVQRDKVVPKAFATDYRSVIVFGRARIVTDDLDRRQALERLNEKYSPEFPEEGHKEIEKCGGRVCIVEVEIEHMSGKQAIRSVREQGQG
jgi:nitroimidazol reductase NimA-like FMN-containing flavoprotein (pyridoxamine 5'-phosphate oxidase superfamily)